MLRLAMNILWPSFLAAIVAEGCFFSLFDPDGLLHLSHQIELSRIAAYTLGFFFFWIFCSLASMLTYYLVNVPRDRRPPF
ncbi:hypothetical protein ACFQAT_09165 [Undibacterium arcticum]|uniref:Inner membrane protein n=1 Tax=Undibacterium arcticum TaxID=1762892 RepID=A0ABV7F1H7_9BURK